MDKAEHTASLTANLPVQVFQSTHEILEFAPIFNKLRLQAALMKHSGKSAQELLPVLEQAYNSINNGHHGFHGKQMPLAARVANWISCLMRACAAQPHAIFEYSQSIGAREEAHLRRTGQL